MNKPSFEYKPPKVSTGRLRTPIEFFEYKPNEGAEPGENEEVSLHSCMCEVYNPSMKDIEVMNRHNTKEGLTVNIRDTKGEYQIDNKHYAEIKDYRYTNLRFNIIDVRHDVNNNSFITVLLGIERG